MGDEKKPAIKEIFVGVSIAVLSAAILAVLGLKDGGGGGGAPAPEAGVPKGTTPREVSESSATADPAQTGTKRHAPSDETGRSEAARLVGLWKAVSFEGGQNVVILWDIKPDRTTHYEFYVTNSLIQEADSVNWSVKNGIFNETILENHMTATAAIEFTDHDSFELTIINNGMSEYEGVKRHYYRQRKASDN
jgi:hypothetical protein